MFIAIKDNIAIACNTTGEFPCMNYDEVREIEFAELYIDKIYTSKEELDKAKAMNETKQSVEEAKKYLSETDWIVVKIAEAETQEEQQELRSKYKESIDKRKEARELINELEN